MTEDQLFDFYVGEKRGWAFRGWRKEVLRWLFPKLLLPLMRLRIRLFPRRSVLFVGQAYYNHWYLSRALRALGWKADLLNWDGNENAQIYYHGHDF
ncbi:MAG: hypothetical protein ACREQ8_19305, partial [Woeseiaceae bacterium]